MWRDIFPQTVERRILGSRVNEVFNFNFKPGTIVPSYSAARVLDLPPNQISSIKYAGHKIRPQIGRFYPSGLLQNVPGIFPQTLTPFRVIGSDNDRIRVDLNHPLSLQELELTVRITAITQPTVERGGRCTDWLEELTNNGPGLQARFQGRKTCFENKYSYERSDQQDDSLFYTAPRLVGHIDSQAGSMLRAIYTRFLSKTDKILDLMSSIDSHLPQGFDLKATGLGLNPVELRKNPDLNNHVVHDLNATGLLPFSDNSFDAVLCSLSIEYLTAPRTIVKEINRVLVPGGKILISFSNRWFPPKVTALWLELHDFERMGLILDYLIENDNFTKLSTFSVRNWPRPADDRHAAELAGSDPVFVVAGIKRLN
jgi:SAM-dependent methyltransferase